MEIIVKALLKRLFASLQLPIDLLLLVLAVPAATILFAYRRVGSVRFPITTSALKKIGIFPIRKHYYEPLFDHSCLTKPLSDDRNLPGIDLNGAAQLAFLSNLNCSQELIDLNLDRSPVRPVDFSLDNNNYLSGDAEFLYQFIRSTRPRKIIEIGSGHSTKLASIAARKNFSETGIATDHICIEPYEMKWLELLDGVTVIRKRLQECNLDWKKELGSNDLLFIDSSHMIRPQGDVLMEYLEILPLLSSGVYVHIHDIFTPKDYLTSWIVNDVLFWNEQYILEAMLSNSARYQVISALNYLKHHHYNELKRVCPYLTPDREPGSFYIQVQ
jgi:predicted O-methyltransferase YrrM